MVDDAPFARLVKTDFLKLAEDVNTDTPFADMERYAWQLACVLFNDDIHDDISASVPKGLHDQYRHRMKKDRLSRLWESIIRDQHASNIEEIQSPEERAFAYLCSHRIEEACKTLIDSRNLHLGTLIPHIGRSSASCRDMQIQVESWRQHNIYSEMSEPIRALYELLAGNCLRSDGKPGVALEDQASTFYFSERFQLDWVQAFGLRLWYGITDEDPIEAAVSLFHRDVTQGNEPAYPFSQFVENPAAVRSDPNRLAQESPLWVILKTYAAAMNNSQLADIPPVRLPEAIMPEAVSGDPLRNRFSFQLFHHISTIIGPHNGVIVDENRADQLTWDYACELSSAQQYPQAIFVLLHLQRAIDRERSLKEYLSRFAAWLPDSVHADGTPDFMWTYLTSDLRVPAAWIWVAKALYARNEEDAPGEVQCLLNAKHWNEAHETFRHVVGPKAIIERDYATLENLLFGFGEAPDKKVRGWSTGAAVYDDFVKLATTRGEKRDTARLKRLVGVLATLGDKVEKNDSSSLEEKVAFREISCVVAGWCAREVVSCCVHGFKFASARRKIVLLICFSLSQVLEPSTILNLPLTQNVRLSHTAEMSRRYYGNIMAGGS